MPRFVDVDPRTLLLNTQRPYPDPVRLHRQIALYGTSAATMPPILVRADPLGRLMLMNGTTRAYRIAKLAPGTLVTVEIGFTARRPFPPGKTIADLIP
jgi:hypothetical protein